LSSQINFVLLISRQGKVRLTKWYSPYTQKERTKVSILYCFLSHSLFCMPLLLFLSSLHCLLIFVVVRQFARVVTRNRLSPRYRLYSNEPHDTTSMLGPQHNKAQRRKQEK
jgi:hypothetical protein